MTEPVLPWISGAIIDLLGADAGVMAACGGHLSGRAGADSSAPYATVQTIANPLINPRAANWRPLAQLTGWSPPATPDGEDPCLSSWRIAAEAARVILAHYDTQLSYLDGAMYYTVELVEGPLEEVDTSRGPDQPMFGARIRIEITVAL